MPERATEATPQKRSSVRTGLAIMLPYVVRRDFLPEETVAGLLDYAILHQSDFIPTKVRSKKFDPTVRVSTRLRQLGSFQEMLELEC